MNKVILMGRLVRDPDIRYTAGEEQTAVAKYTLAVDRSGRQNQEQTADFINCTAFGRRAEFAEKYLHKGIKIIVTGRIQTGSYTHRDSGLKIYTTDVIVEEHEFCESKNSNQSSNTSGASPYGPVNSDGFMNIPDGIEEHLPFN